MAWFAVESAIRFARNCVNAEPTVCFRMEALDEQKKQLELAQERPEDLVKMHFHEIRDLAVLERRRDLNASGSKPIMRVSTTEKLRK